MRALLFDEAAEAEMRILYAHLGVSPETIEAAILMRRKPPEPPVITSPIKGKKRKGSKGKFYYTFK